MGYPASLNKGISKSKGEFIAIFDDDDENKKYRISSQVKKILSCEKKYKNDRKAMGHYRIASPFLALCLVILATAIMLHGRILRETVNRRILIVALLGIMMQAGLILCRSLTANTPFLWPSLYLVILLPMIFGLYLIVKPTAFAIFWSRSRPQSPLKTSRDEQ